MANDAVGSSIFEIGFGCEAHLVLFGFGDGVEAIAVDGGLAVFDFGEVDFIVFDADDVDFVEVGFVVFGYNGVIVVY